MGKTPNSLTTNRSRAVTVKSELEVWSPPAATEQPSPSSPTHHRRYFCGPSSNAAEHNMETSDLVHCPLSPMEESSHCLNCKRQGPHCFTGILLYLWTYSVLERNSTNQCTLSLQLQFIGYCLCLGNSKSLFRTTALQFCKDRYNDFFFSV